MLLGAMPIEDRPKDLNDLDLRQDVLPVQNLIITHGIFLNRQSTHNRNEKLKQTSLIFRPNPFLDERELLRLEGQLQQTAFADEVKHPAVVLRRVPKLWYEAKRP